METCWKFIVQETATHYYCVLCGSYAYEYGNAHQHYHGELHAKALDLFGYDIKHEGGEDYYCYLCRCWISGHLNIRPHVDGMIHSRKLDKYGSMSSDSDEYDSLDDDSMHYDSPGYYSMDDESDMSYHRSTDDMSLSDSDSIDYKHLPCNFVTGNKTTGEFECYLCNMFFDSEWKAWYHQNDPNHIGALNVDGKYIFDAGIDGFFCDLCSVYFPSAKNIYQHIKGGPHRSFLPSQV